MESKKPIGLILNDLRKEKRITAVELGERLSVTKQTIYETFKTRQSMSMDDLERWAIALETDVQTLIDKAAGKTGLSVKSVDNGSFGEEVLQTIKKLLEEEIREKNEQIRALQDALKESQQLQRILLGKSHEYPNVAMIPNQHNGSIMYGPIR